MRGLKGEDDQSHDKDHYIAYSAGAVSTSVFFRSDQNLIADDPSTGKRFRKIERCAAMHPGTFVFARPIYANESWTPAELEYGTLLPEQRLWVERFSN